MTFLSFFFLLGVYNLVVAETSSQTKTMQSLLGILCLSFNWSLTTLALQALILIYSFGGDVLLIILTFTGILQSNSVGVSLIYILIPVYCFPVLVVIVTEELLSPSTLSLWESGEFIAPSLLVLVFTTLTLTLLMSPSSMKVSV